MFPGCDGRVERTRSQSRTAGDERAIGEGLQGLSQHRWRIDEDLFERAHRGGAGFDRAISCDFELPHHLDGAVGRLGRRGLRRWLVRAGGQDCDGPFVRQAPIGSRPIRSASYRMIRRWAMTDRSKRGHEVSQLEGQAITHRHPPVSPSDTDRRENDAHSQLVEGSALLPREIDAVLSEYRAAANLESPHVRL